MNRQQITVLIMYGHEPNAIFPRPQYGDGGGGGENVFCPLTSATPPTYASGFCIQEMVARVVIILRRMYD